MTEFFIIGADAAGLSAAVQIKRIKPEAAVKVINKGKFISYGACGIPYVIGGAIDSPEKLLHFTPESFEKTRKVPVEIRKEAIDINPEAKEVVIKDLATGEVMRQAYGRLLIATGTIPRPLPFIDYQDRAVFNLHNIEDLEEIMSFLKEEDPARAVIIGAGVIGLELTEALVQRGLEVTIIEALEDPIAAWPAFLRKAVRKKLRERNVSLLTGTLVRSVDRTGPALSVKTDGAIIEADVLFSVVGTRPAADFCGDKLDRLDNGAIIIDRHCRTSKKDIFSAGDCATAYHRILDRNDYIPLGSTANKLGRIAGMNMAGEKVAYPGILGTQIFKCFDLSIAKTGLHLKEAAAAGFDAVSFKATRMDRAGYYPGADPAKVEIICERDSGLMLGAAAVTHSNAAQIIDPAAMAVQGRISIRELAWFDAAYTPPYAPVWNALISAAFKGLGKI